MYPIVAGPEALPEGKDLKQGSPNFLYKEPFYCPSGFSEAKLSPVGVENALNLVISGSKKNNKVPVVSRRRNGASSVVFVEEIVPHHWCLWNELCPIVCVSGMNSASLLVSVRRNSAPL